MRIEVKNSITGKSCILLGKAIKLVTEYDEEYGTPFLTTITLVIDSIYQGFKNYINMVETGNYNEKELEEFINFDAPWYDNFIEEKYRENTSDSYLEQTIRINEGESSYTEIFDDN